MKAVQGFYVDRRVCVRVGNDVSGFRLMSCTQLICVRDKWLQLMC